MGLRDASASKKVIGNIKAFACSHTNSHLGSPAVSHCPCTPAAHRIAFYSGPASFKIILHGACFSTLDVFVCHKLV